MAPLCILITGAASGIGLALSQALANDGHHIIVSDLNAEEALKVTNEINQSGGRADAFSLDVSQQSQIDNISTHLPRIDVLINNAGIQYVSKLEEFPCDKWRQLTDILLVGPAMLSRAVLPNMKANNFGRIINIGSIHSVVASPYKSAYVAAKHGLIGFSKTVALETADFDITINTLCPSYVKTPLVEQQIAQQASTHGISESDVINNIMLEPMPKKAFISPREIVDTCKFLCSSSAKNITGQSIVLDGGWTAK